MRGGGGGGRVCVKTRVLENRSAVVLDNRAGGEATSSYACVQDSPVDTNIETSRSRRTVKIGPIGF